MAAPDKFKGSLTAAEAAYAISVGLKRGYPAVATVLCPVADGGDGTLGTVLAAGFEKIPVSAEGPTGQLVHTAYARSGKIVLSKWRKSVACNGFPEACPLL